MQENFQKKIVELIAFKGIKLKVSLRDGKFSEVNTVTFSHLCKLLDIDYPKNREQLIEIKKQLMDLISGNRIVKLESEPPYYLLKDEVDKKFGSISNISGIEGYIVM